jgi:tRNA (Thr-GGU) A37 N-methylase
MKSTIGLVICEIVKVKKLYVEIQLLDTWENTWKQ